MTQQHQFDSLLKMPNSKSHRLWKSYQKKTIASSIEICVFLLVIGIDCDVFAFIDISNEVFFLTANMEVYM